MNLVPTTRQLTGRTQVTWSGRRVRVTFLRGEPIQAGGVLVRDDDAAQIIRLDDGQVILGDECLWSPCPPVLVVRGLVGTVTLDTTERTITFERAGPWARIWTSVGSRTVSLNDVTEVKLDRGGRLCRGYLAVGATVPTSAWDADRHETAIGFMPSQADLAEEMYWSIRQEIVSKPNKHKNLKENR